MATKHTDKCLEKAGDDEPIFVLRSTDKLAPLIVRIWAEMAKIHDCSEDKTDEAEVLAYLMEKWQIENGCKWPD